MWHIDLHVAAFFSINFSRELVKAVELVVYISCARSRSKLRGFHFLVVQEQNQVLRGCVAVRHRELFPMFCFWIVSWSFWVFFLIASLRWVTEHSSSSHRGKPQEHTTSREKRGIVSYICPVPAECVQIDLKPVKTFLSCRSVWALGTGARRAAWVWVLACEKLVIGLQN